MFGSFAIPEKGQACRNRIVNSIEDAWHYPADGVELDGFNIKRPVLAMGELAPYLLIDGVNRGGLAAATQFLYGELKCA